MHTPRSIRTAHLALLIACLAGVHGAACADEASKQRLVTLLRDREVSADPHRLLYALGGLELELDGPEIVGALAASAPPVQARLLLSNASRLSSKEGGVRLERAYATKGESVAGEPLGFGTRIGYRVYGRDLVGIRGLYGTVEGEVYQPLPTLRDLIPAPVTELARPTEPARPTEVELVRPMGPVSGLPGKPALDAAQPALEASPQPSLPGPSLPALERRGTTAAPAIGIESALRDVFQLGQRSDSARLLQARLNDHRRAAGLAPIAESGVYDAATVQALEDFQRAAGLAPTSPRDPASAAALASAPDYTGQVGLRGSEVAALQARLNEHRAAAGLAPIEADGVFGGGTEEALSAFQKEAGVPVTGSADAATDAALARAPSYGEPARGDGGARVLALQRQLNEHRRAAGVAAIGEDGVFGGGTEDALRALQEARGLPSTGLLDAATSEALDRPPVEVEPLARGDEGARVVALQEDLNAHREVRGLRALEVDGDFGGGTEDALRAFQRDADLPETGLADGPTLSAADADPSLATHPAMSVSASDLEVLARIVKGECPESMPWEGKVAVAAVVLNRVRSRAFPNSIPGVAHQPAQFSCYNSNFRRQLYYGAIPDYAWRAARAALAGQDPSLGSTYYFNPFLVDPPWRRTKVFVRRIGREGSRSVREATTHDFYRQP